MKAGLGDQAKNVIAEVTYEVSDPTVDSQIATLKASGADTFVNVTTPKFAAQAIRKAYDIGWKPTEYLSSVAASVGAVLTPAGLEKSVGLVTVGYFKDPTDKQWDDDPAVKEWKAFMKEYVPDGQHRRTAATRTRTSRRRRSFRCSSSAATTCRERT